MVQMTSGNLAKKFTIYEKANKLSKEAIKLVLAPDVIRHAQMIQG